MVNIRHKFRDDFPMVLQPTQWVQFALIIHWIHRYTHAIVIFIRVYLTPKFLWIQWIIKVEYRFGFGLIKHNFNNITAVQWWPVGLSVFQSFLTRTKLNLFSYSVMFLQWLTSPNVTFIQPWPLPLDTKYWHIILPDDSWTVWVLFSPLYIKMSLFDLKTK